MPGPYPASPLLQLALRIEVTGACMTTHHHPKLKPSNITLSRKEHQLVIEWNDTHTSFYNLNALRWGDQIIVNAYGYRYIYEVRSVHYVGPNDTSVLDHKDLSWITLLTCAGYDEAQDNYRYRLAVEAVRISTEKR